MTETEMMAPPKLNSIIPMSKFDRERLAFARLRPELLLRFRDQFVAIHEEKVVGVGDDLRQVAFEAYGRFGYVPIYVDLVTDKPVRPVRIPSPREMPRG